MSILKAKKLMNSVNYAKHRGVSACNISRHLSRGHIEAAKVKLPGRKTFMIDVDIADGILDWRKNNFTLILSIAKTGAKYGARKYKEGAFCVLHEMACKSCHVEIVLKAKGSRKFCSNRCRRIYGKMQRLGYAFCCQCDAELSKNDERAIGIRNIRSGDNRHDGYCRRCMKFFFHYELESPLGFICKDCGGHFLVADRGRKSNPTYRCKKCHNIFQKKYRDTHPEIIKRVNDKRVEIMEGYRRNLSDEYLRILITKRSFLHPKDVPKTMVELLRSEIKLLRQLGKAGVRVPNLKKDRGVL